MYNLGFFQFMYLRLSSFHQRFPSLHSPSPLYQLPILWHQYISFVRISDLRIVLLMSIIMTLYMTFKRFSHLKFTTVVFLMIVINTLLHLYK